MGQGGGLSHRPFRGCLPLRGLLPLALPVGGEEKGAVPGKPRARSPSSQVPAPHVGTAGGGSRRAGAEPRRLLSLT